MNLRSKGEGQGPFRMGPHRPPPCTPSPLHPASGSLAEGGSRSLPFRQAFLYRENVIVLAFVSPQRFLIIGLLKTDNSLMLKQSVFLTQPLIRNLYLITERIGLDVLEFAGLVWLSPNIAKLVFIFKRRSEKSQGQVF